MGRLDETPALGLGLKLTPSLKSLRPILIALAWLAAVAGVLAALAFAPLVQTWAARRLLARQTDAEASLDYARAGFGQVHLDGLRLSRSGAELKVPALDAELPVLDAAWKGKIRAGSLAARGWTLDLTHAAAAGAFASGREAGAAELLGLLLGRWRLPRGFSLDRIELEGDVLLPGGSDSAPVRVHLLAEGGGLAAGRQARLPVELSFTAVDSQFQVFTVLVRGASTVTVDSSGAIARVGFAGTLLPKGGPLPSDLALSVALAAEPGPDRLTGDVVARRGDRFVASLSAGFRAAAGTVRGSWRLDAGPSDIGLLPGGFAALVLRAVGAGSFEADPAFTRVRAAGSLHTLAARPGAQPSPSGLPGIVGVDADFALAHAGRSLHVDRLSARVTAGRATVRLRALEPFAVDEEAGTLAADDPGKDWLEAAVAGLPIEQLGPLPGGFSLRGGDVSGSFRARISDGGFVLRTETPLSAAGVALVRRGAVLEDGLQLSLPLSAKWSSKGWRLQGAPFTAARSGRTLASVRVEASRTQGPDQPVAVDGAWTAELNALGFGGGSASGSFSVSLGAAPSADAQLQATGADPARTITASLHVEQTDSGDLEFDAPIRTAFGGRATELSLRGTWYREETGSRLDAQLTADNADSGQLLALAGPLAAAASGVRSGDSRETPDAGPFWGFWNGRFRAEFGHLKAGDRELKNVSATFAATPDSLSLKEGRAEVPDLGPVGIEGEIRFGGGSRRPYRLTAAGAISNEIDAAAYLPPPEDGRAAVLEGKFSAAATWLGDGATLRDLVGRTRMQLQLSSTAGVVRLLRTNVAETISQPNTPVRDSLKSVGSAVGSFFGVQHANPSDIRLDPNTQAVIDFSNQMAEIGYDRLSLNVMREESGAIRLSDIEVLASGAHLTGSGVIGASKGLPLGGRPIALEMKLGVRAGEADLLADAGLLSDQTDDQGYNLLRPEIVFGGTLDHIDNKAWRDLLAQAAARKSSKARPAQP